LDSPEEIFEELRAAADRIYREVDSEMLETAYVQGSPAWLRVEQDLETLSENRHRFLRDYQTLELTLVDTTPNRLRLREVVVSDGRIVDASGEDVTGQRTPEKQTIDWDLRLAGGSWLIYEGTVVKSVPGDK
jgi:hypothetical protein